MAFIFNAGIPLLFTEAWRVHKAVYPNKPGAQEGQEAWLAPVTYSRPISQPAGG